MPHGPPSNICFAQCRVAARYQQTGVGDPSGRLVGKAALRAYFEEALQKLTDVSLDLQVSGNSKQQHMLTKPCRNGWARAALWLQPTGIAPC